MQVGLTGKTKLLTHNKNNRLNSLKNLVMNLNFFRFNLYRSFTIKSKTV